MSNIVIANSITSVIENQLPSFVREQDPNFTAFIKAYYSWLETSNDTAVLSQSRSLLSYQDIDTTTSQFIQYFINDFLPYFPNDVVIDQRKLLKQVKNFYQKKGSVESIQFLFRVLYGKEAEIYFPKNNILRASAGTWTLPQSLRLVLSEDNLYFDINQLVGRQGKGAVSGATCVIESATKTVDQGLGIELIEIYVSNVEQIFNDLEDLNVIYGYDANNNPLVFTEQIIASISNIVINPNFPGLKYKGYIENGLGQITYQGDPVVISGGLETGDPNAQKAVAYVGNVTSGSLTKIAVNFGGFGYRLFPNTEVTVINDPSDTTGTGANVIIQSVDTLNSVYVLVNTDSINYKNSVALSSSNFNFANVTNCNINTNLQQAFSYVNTSFAAITSMNVINGGGDFTATPSLNLAVTYYTDFASDLANINYAGLANNVDFIDNLGLICNVVITSGGTGYSNVTDMIVVPSAIGYNAAFSFQTTGNGTISLVTITNRGGGYIALPENLLVVNSANIMNASAGQGAFLIAYGFGQGANLSVGVNQIGEIIDFRIVSRGFDYISTPNVSLRIQDFVINPISNSLSFTTDAAIYQGTSLNAATWKANVDSYNVESSILRIYNYQGDLNSAATLYSVGLNVTINIANTSNVTTYGDGLAKANAIFLNGLIQYPGFWLTTDGFLSSDQYLQDSETYHNYSYVIVVEKALRDYKQMLMQLAHPAGTSMLGSYSVIQNQESSVVPNANVNIIPVVAGSVSTTGISNIVSGIGTSFGISGNIGDMIVFPTNDDSRRSQVKTITNVYNIDYINIDSNTSFFHYTLANVSTSSNLVFATNVYGNIGIGDSIKMNVSGNIITSNVLLVTQNTLTVNTIFASNSSNMVILVYPVITNGSYSIVQSAT